ncbi:ryncolin-4-like [Styela clava]
MAKIYIADIGIIDVRYDFHTDEESWLVRTSKNFYSNHLALGVRIEVAVEVVLRRSDGSVFFDRNWNDYAKGFGDLKTEFWFEIPQFDRHLNFRIASSYEKYKLTIGEYTGDLGDMLKYSDQNPFLTKDHDNDDVYFFSCAKMYKGGWWFRECHKSHLTGPYVIDEVVDRNVPGMKW